MLSTRGFAAKNASSQLGPISFERREVGKKDILIEIHYCGVCHSDIHQVRDEWGGSIFPMVPGHEIVGRVARVGAGVTRFKAGDLAGVGCFVDSCRKCENCDAGEEQFCDVHLAATYNGTEMDKKTPTYGGYSTQIVVDEDFTLRIPTNLSPAAAAPLLCAGITTYSPLRRWKVGPGQRVGVVGLGGLGHMAVKFAAAFGAEVTVLSSTRKKEEDARRLGAHHFVAASESGALAKQKHNFDFILNTVSAPHDLNAYLDLLKTGGAMVLVGVPDKPATVPAFGLIARRRILAGSLIGGIRETQEMLDFCGQKNIASDIEMIEVSQINAAYERMLRGDVRYRFVIDSKTI